MNVQMKEDFDLVESAYSQSEKNAWKAGYLAGIAAQQPTLAKNQPCGCVICTCENETQCQGCGAKSCGTHAVGQIPNPVYLQSQAQQEVKPVARVIDSISYGDARLWIVEGNICEGDGLYKIPASKEAECARMRRIIFEVFNHDSFFDLPDHLKDRIASHVDKLPPAPEGDKE